MKLQKFTPSEFASNNYIVWNEKTGSAAIFDPSLCFFDTSSFIKKNKLNLKYILITHVHFDHLYDVKKIQKNFENVKTCIPFGDKLFYQNIQMQCDMFGVRRIDEFKADEFIDENSSLFLDDIQIKIIHTPGHTKGSLCYLIEDCLISGDTLFFEEIGRCDLPTGSFSDMTHSIKDKLFNLDDNIKVFTGHGDNTTIGHEKKYNAYFGNLSKE